MDEKVKEELLMFHTFKQQYQFELKPIIKKQNDYYVDGELLQHGEEKAMGETEKWINAGYQLKGDYCKVLSNLFPYEFTFRGKQMQSIESFFQGIKIKEKNTQDYIFQYSGLEANVLKSASDYNWQENGILYWQGNPIKRDSQEYDDMIEELYICAIQNPLYRNVLKRIEKPIIHSIGKEAKEETTFTRYEFEKMLNCLVAFLKGKE